MKPLVVGVLASASLLGCASLPQRYDYAQIKSMTDHELCIVGMSIPKTHPDADPVVEDYKRRQREGAFVHQWCLDYFALEKSKKDSADRAAIGQALLYIAIGAASAYVARPTATYLPIPTPTPPPNYAPVAPNRPYVAPAPFAPIPITYLLTNQTVDRAYTTRLCSYGGTSTVIIMASHEVCPASVPR